LTASTERSSLLSRRFDFDHEILGSKVYQGQIRSWIRRGLRRESNPDGSSSVENQLKRDRLSERKTQKLLLIEPPDGEQSMGLEKFELWNTRNIGNDLRLSYKAHIISIVYDAMRTILQEMKEVGSHIWEDPKYQNYIQTLLMQLTTSESDSFPIDVAIAIAALWENEAVKQLYNRCKGKIYWRASD
jgi:hypothetical protein